MNQFLLILDKAPIMHKRNSPAEVQLSEPFSLLGLLTGPRVKGYVQQLHRKVSPQQGTHLWKTASMEFSGTVSLPAPVSSSPSQTTYNRGRITSSGVGIEWVKENKGLEFQVRVWRSSHFLLQGMLINQFLWSLIHNCFHVKRSTAVCQPQRAEYHKPIRNVT